MKNKIFKKACSYMALLVLMITAIFTFIGCQNNEAETKYVNEEIVMTKEQCIDKAKSLLDITDIYFFDCDFSNLTEIKIIDVSYNISINGTLISNEKEKTQIIDLNKQAIIKIVTNYRISGSGNCFGFSVVNSIIQPKMEHYKNGELEYKSPNIIYTRNSFNNINDLHNNGATTSQNNSVAYDIKVPKEFYPYDLIPNGYSIKSSYLLIQGNINSLEDISVLDTISSILIHYQSINEAQYSDTMLKTILDYYNQNARYTKH